MRIAPVAHKKLTLARVWSHVAPLPLQGRDVVLDKHPNFNIADSTQDRWLFKSGAAKTLQGACVNI